MVDTQEKFYAYRSHGDVGSYPVTMDSDAGTGDPVHPAGDVMCFATEEERDAYVGSGRVTTTNEAGRDRHFHAVHAISGREAGEFAERCASSRHCLHRSYASRGRVRISN